MDFNIICAVAMNGVIGDSTSNSIPWHLPSDLKRFKALTTGKTVVMGSNTFISLGRKLPNRRNVVLTRNAVFAGAGTELPFEPDIIYPSFEAALQNEQNVMVIGGESVFKKALELGPKRLYMTLVMEDISGDVFFPIEGRRMLRSNHADDDYLVAESWVYTVEERLPIADENNIAYQYVTYVRK